MQGSRASGSTALAKQGVPPSLSGSLSIRGREVSGCIRVPNLEYDKETGVDLRLWFASGYSN